VQKFIPGIFSMRALQFDVNDIGNSLTASSGQRSALVFYSAGRAALAQEIVDNCGLGVADPEQGFSRLGEHRRLRPVKWNHLRMAVRADLRGPWLVDSRRMRDAGAIRARLVFLN
jgi:hypothetical protein